MRNVSKMLARGAAAVAGAALLFGGAVGCEDPDPESNALVEELQEKPGEPVVEDKEAAPGRQHQGGGRAAAGQPHRGGGPGEPDQRHQSGG